MISRLDPIRSGKERGISRIPSLSPLGKGCSLSGRIDQGAGILFNLKPNGDYLTIRANCLEENLVLWKFEKGRRSSVNWVRNTPTATHQWHELKIRISGTKVEGYLDGKLYLQHTLTEPVSGRIGLWSKADSHMYFSDYTVTTPN
jgi:laminin G domain protein